MPHVLPINHLCSLQPRRRVTVTDVLPLLLLPVPLPPMLLLPTPKSPTLMLRRHL